MLGGVFFLRVLQKKKGRWCELGEKLGNGRMITVEVVLRMQRNVFRAVKDVELKIQKKAHLVTV